MDRSVRAKEAGLLFLKGTLVGLITLGSLSSFAFAEGQILGDPSFELSTPNGTFPNSGYWNPADPGGGADACCVANGVANHSGNNGLWDYTGNETWAWWSAPYQEFSSVAPGKLYNVNAWIRQPHSNPYPPYDHGWVSGSEAFVRIEFLNSSKNLISYVDGSPKITSDNQSWLQSSISNAIAPANTAYVRFTCRVQKPNGSAGISVACFDDCFLEELEPPNQPPTVYIDSILPSPAQQGEEVSFSGHGEDVDGTVVAYEWNSSIDGSLSTSATFATTILSTGTHTISFKVQDDDGAWSEEATATLEVGPSSMDEVFYSDEGIPIGTGILTWGYGSFDGKYIGENPPEGDECFKTASSNWAGWGILYGYWDDPVNKTGWNPQTNDLSVYSDGELKFYVKTLDDLKVEIEAPRYHKRTKYISQYGWDGTNVWREISIPISDFGFSEEDLSQVYGAFLATITTSGTFYIDHVRWSRIPGELDHIVVSPASATVPCGLARQFVAEGYDTEGKSVPINPTWSTTGGIGEITPLPDACAVLNASSTPSSGQVIAAANGKEGRADVIVEGITWNFSFNVYSDQGAAGYIGVDKNTGSSFEIITDNTTSTEGSESMKATYDIVGDGWGSWYCEEGGPDRNERKNMMEYEAGYLVFDVKTEVDLEIGIRSSNIPAGNEKSKGMLSEYGILLDGQWQEVYIPLSDFKLKEPELDFKRIEVYFNVAVVGKKVGAASGEFWIDDVRWLTQSPPVPNSPTNLSASPVSATQIDLTWQDNATNELWFILERKEETGDFVQVAVVNADVTTYQDLELAPETNYSYRVRAYNNGGDSGYSTEAYATTLADPTGTPEERAYLHLYEIMDRYHKSFDVYTDGNAGGNHYYPSGWYNTSDTVNNMTLNTNCGDNPHSGISCIKMVWDGGPGADGYKWNGIVFQEPENNWTESGQGYDLTGATKLTFWARTDDPGLRVKFLVGYAEEGLPGDHPGDSCGEILINEDGWIQLYPVWTKYEIGLLGKDLSDVSSGFAFAFNDREDPDPDGCTIYLDEIKYHKESLDELRFLVSYETTAEDTYSRNTCYIYDNVLAMLDVMARGTPEDWERAGILAEGFVAAQENDRYFEDGRLRNAYQSGDLIDRQTGKARLPGWWEEENWWEDYFQVSTHTGNLAWTMIALLHYYKTRGGTKYLTAAENLGNWICDNCSDTRGAGGYTAGVEGWDTDQIKLTYKSTEHNIDVHVAFMLLYEATGDTTWRERAFHAKRFVKAMWDEEEGHFWTGTTDDGTTINKDVVPLDIQPWALMALGEIEKYDAGLDWAETNCLVDPCPQGCGFKGFDFNTDKDGVWFEGTGQMSVAYQITEDENSSENFVVEIEKAQISANKNNGKGIVAACHDGVTTGFKLPPDYVDDWVYYNRLHIGATAWYLFARREYNPYWSISTSDLIPHQSPIILEITPDSGANTGTIDVTITGANFQDGVSVKLTKETFSIIGTSTTVTNTTTITTIFDLIDAEEGLWDVVVINPDGQSDTLSNGFRVTGCTPAIEFTYMPPYCSFENLKGQVLCVNPADYKVAVYIFVASGWWTKPYWTSPLTSINDDGSWTCDITSGGIDQLATEITAFLVPNGYDPPLMSGGQILPYELYEASVADTTLEREAIFRKVEFSGYIWNVKASETRAGPGPNYFSDEEEDVWVDEEGRLHLRIVQRNGRWYCTEVFTEAPLGYGRYIFHLDSRVDQLDKNIVLGLFTWDDTASEHNYREIDIEFIKEGEERDTNTQYVVQPWQQSENIHRFNMELNEDNSTHGFDWRADHIFFQSLHGHQPFPGPEEDEIESWTYTEDDIPPEGEGNARINLWLFNGNSPSDGQEVEVIVKVFEFAPLSPKVVITKSARNISQRGYGSEYFDPEGVLEGDTIEFKISLENVGVKAATDVIVSDTVPEGLNYISGSISEGGDDSQAPVLKWDLETISGGDSEVLTFQATAD